MCCRSCRSPCPSSARDWVRDLTAPKPPKIGMREGLVPSTKYWVRIYCVFFVHIPKIFILKHLWDGDRVESPQNLEPQGLSGKIFWNKDLASSSNSMRKS